jgi:hypothetical protein
MATPAPWYVRLRPRHRLWAPIDFPVDFFCTIMATGGGQLIDCIRFGLADLWTRMTQAFLTAYHKGDPMPQVVRITPHVYMGNLAAALQAAYEAEMNQPGHLPFCVGVHCQAHRVFFQGELFCQTKSFYKTAKFPGTRFCKKCIEQVEQFGGAGVVMEYQL